MLFSSRLPTNFLLRPLLPEPSFLSLRRVDPLHDVFILLVLFTLLMAISTMYYSSKKPYSPVKSAFPRRYLDPSRIVLVAIVLLLIFFFRFESIETTTVTDDVREIFRPAPALPGFRPLNESRIAIVTFITEQKSFTHLSLKNKACMYWTSYSVERAETYVHVDRLRKEAWIRLLHRL